MAGIRTQTWVTENDSSLGVTEAESSGLHVSQVGECAICLEGFAHGEKVRELPQCCHVFHQACVDRWLRMHNACPLCRTALGTHPGTGCA